MTAPYHHGGKPAWLDETPKIPIGLLVNAFAKQDNELDHIFRTVLAQAIPGYQDRPQQRDMAQAVYRCCEQSRHGVIEAGTGTGKSFGLLIPAFLRALKYGKRTIIATGTLVLQDQYRKDLAFLDRVLGPYFAQKHGRKQTWAVFKGRSNFYCWEGDEVQGFATELELINEWLETTETGDLNDLPIDLTQERYRPLRQAITADAEDCPGKQKCPSGETCFYYGAKSKAEEADIVVVNHMILALDMLLDGQLLPEHDAVFVDEAHKLPSWVRNATEAKLSRSRLTYLRRKADKLQLKTENLQQAGEVFFDQAERLVVARLKTNDETPDDEPSCRLQGEDFAGGSLDALIGELQRAEDVLAAKQDVPRAEALAKSLKQFRLDLSSLTKANPGKLLWAKQERGKDGVLLALAMRLTMIRVAPFLRETLLKRTCIFASATLATGPNDFDFFCGEIGLEGCHKMQVASPFDYRRNLQFYVPALDKNMLERQRLDGKLETRQQQTARIATVCEPIYRKMLGLTGGNALLLFTSKTMMLGVFRRLSRPVQLPSGRIGPPWPIRKQGDAPKGQLTDWLRGRVHVAPPGHLRHVDRVTTERAWHLLVGLQEHRPCPEEPGHIVGVGPQAEVAVAVRQGGRSDDQRTAHRMAQDVGHLAEVHRDEVDRARMEVRPCDCGQEVRHMPQTVPVTPVEVAAIDQGVHLVDPDVVDATRCSCGLDHVEHRTRFTGGQGDHQIGVRSDEVHDRVDRSGPVPGHLHVESGPVLVRYAGPRRRPAESVSRGAGTPMRQSASSVPTASR